MSGILTSIRFIMALLTVLAILAKPLIPPRTLILFPNAKNTISIYGPENAEGKSGVRWLDKSKSSWRCDYVQRSVTDGSCGFVLTWISKSVGQTVYTDEFPPCQYGMSDPDGDGWGWENEQSCIVTDATQREFSAPENTADYPTCNHSISDPDGDSWGLENGQLCQVRAETIQNVEAQLREFRKPTSIDASSYDGFVIKINYEGRADYINLNLRDAGSAPLTEDTSEKFMSALVRTEDLRKGPVFVGFNAFAVDEWWVFQQNPPRELAGSEFGHLVQVGLHYPEFGVHRMTVEEIKLIGERISDKNYLLIIMIIWVVYLLTEAGLRYRHLVVSTRRDQEQLRTLNEVADKLVHEKGELQIRSITDLLTGVKNRHGLVHQLRGQYGGDLLPADTGVVVMDIDHFKTLNDTYGHEAGDLVLKEFAKRIANAVRERDIFARWGGEEFVLVVSATSPDKLSVVCEKLRELVAECRFLPEHDQVVTVSMGATLTRQIEPFDAAFRRADSALYRAKTQRNAVAYAE